jgi:hypothetical protein
MYMRLYVSNFLEQDAGSSVSVVEHLVLNAEVLKTLDGELFLFEGLIHPVCLLESLVALLDSLALLVLLLFPGESFLHGIEPVETIEVVSHTEYLEQVDNTQTEAIVRNEGL